MAFLVCIGHKNFCHMPVDSHKSNSRIIRLGHGPVSLVEAYRKITLSSSELEQPGTFWATVTPGLPLVTEHHSMTHGDGAGEQNFSLFTRRFIKHGLVFTWDKLASVL